LNDNVRDKEEDEKKIWILIKREYGDEKAG